MGSYLTYSGDTVAQTQNLMPQWSLYDIDSSAISALQPLVKVHSASEIFSAGSTLGAQMTPDIAPHALVVQITQPWEISLFILLTLCYYIYILYRYWDVIPTTFRVAMSVGKTLNLYQQQNNEQKRFGINTFALFIMSLTVTVVEVSDNFINATPILFVGIVFVALCLLFTFKYIAVTICRSFSDDKPAFHDLNRINLHTISLFSIIYTPIAIAAATGDSQNTMLLVIVAVLWIYYIIRLFGLFMQRGFGKLQWILYLCAVELLPSSYLIAMAFRF